MLKSVVTRVLVRLPNWIGDAVMCEPALSAVRRCFPRAALTVLARPAVAELLQSHPAVQAMLVYDSRGRHRGMAGRWALIRRLREERFELAVLFQNAFEAALLSFLAGIPRRIGYATDGRGFLLTQAVTRPAGSPLQQVEYYLKILRPLGYEGTAEAPRLYLRPEEQAAMETRLRQAGVGAEEVLIGVNPGSTYGSAKRWLPERFAETAERLIRFYRSHHGRSARVIILGAAGEEALGEQIAGKIGPPAIAWSGRTSIRDLMAVTQRCRLYVTNDTGPMHVAAAFGVPVVAIFGPTDWRTTAPFGGRHTVVRQPVDCSPCLLRECPIDHRCMTRVSVDQVVEAAEALSASNSQCETAAAQDSRFSTQASALSTRHSGPSTRDLPLEGVTVFLDRDGTLIRDAGYLSDPEKLEWGPGVMEGLARLKKAGARLVVVTNQSGIARGLLTTQQLTAIHAKLRTDIAGHGVMLDGIYVCPHYPDDGCPCRKPQPGLVEQARRELGIEGHSEYVVGDRNRDMELGRRIGARTILLSAESGSDGDWVPSSEGRTADRVATHFSDVVDWIVADAQRQRETTRRGQPSENVK